ncbi:MAG: Cache 3/Cache 2 fusion domain-containing protein [Chlamydiales bacterium]
MKKSAVAHVNIKEEFARAFPEPFSVDFKRVEKWENHEIPLLRSGNVIFKDTRVLDALIAKVHADVAIFVKVGDDFIRVVTTLKQEDGSSARGTHLNHSNPAYEHLLKGHGFTGRVNLFGHEFDAEYEAIKDKDGKIIGAYRVGNPISK